MFAKSTVTASVLAGGLALAGLAAATWMTPSRAQEPGNDARIKAGPRRIGSRRRSNNLKQILLAFHNYADTNNHLPAVATYGPDGLPKLSWRVALLPYLDEDDLYRSSARTSRGTARTTRRWSPGCRPSSRRPSSPRPRARPGSEGSRAKGPSSMARRASASRTSPTARRTPCWSPSPTRPTPWTKPGELPFVAGRPLPALDDSDPDGYQFGLVDGSVRSLPLEEAKLLPALITRAGGEVIQWPAARPAGNATTVEATTTALPDRERDDRRGDADVAPDPSRRTFRNAGRRSDGLHEQHDARSVAGATDAKAGGEA